MNTGIHKSQFIVLTAGFIAFLAGAVILNQFFIAIIPFAFLLLYAGWQQPAMIFLLLMVSIPFSFEFNFSPTLGTDIPDEGLMVLVSILFFAWYLYRPRLLSRGTLSHPLLILLGIHLCWIGLSVILSTQSLLSVKYLLAKGWYIGAFILAPLVLFREKKWIATSALVLASGMFLIVLIALLRHYGSGFSFTSVNESVAPFFRNHVTYSSILVCMLPVWLAVYRLSANAITRKWILAIMLVTLVALFFSYARGAWLALGAGILAWWLMRKKMIVIAFVIFIGVASLVAAWLQSGDRYLDYAHNYRTTIFHEDFTEHLVATYKLKDVSTAERFYRWVAAGNMIGEKPLTGFGPNTFYDNYKPYAIPAYKTWVSDNPEHSTVHNYFLLLLVEQGIPGLIFFLFLLGAMLYYAQALYHRLRDKFYRNIALATGMIVVMIAVVNFLSDLIETDKVGSIFFLCLVSLVMTDRNTRQTLEASPDVERVP